MKNDIIKIDNLNKYYAIAMYRKLHRQSDPQHYLLTCNNTDINSIKTIINLNNGVDSVGIVTDGFTLNSFYKPEKIIFDMHYLVACIRNFKRVCCNINDYIKVRDKCKDLMVNYTNVVINIENNATNNTIYNTILDDIIQAYNINRKAFNVKLIIFPIKNTLYYFYKEPIIKYRFISGNEFVITSMNAYTYVENETKFNL